jgi:hypothetical protein
MPEYFGTLIAPSLLILLFDCPRNQEIAPEERNLASALRLQKQVVNQDEEDSRISDCRLPGIPCQRCVSGKVTSTV